MYQEKVERWSLFGWGHTGSYIDNQERALF
jgi:hypothetical protein